MNRRAFLSLATLAAARPLIGLPKGVERVLFEPELLQAAVRMDAVGLDAMAHEVLKGLMDEYARTPVVKLETEEKRRWLIGDHARIVGSWKGALLTNQRHVGQTLNPGEEIDRRELAHIGRMLGAANIHDGVTAFAPPPPLPPFTSEWARASHVDGFSVRVIYAPAATIDDRWHYALRFDTLGGKA